MQFDPLKRREFITLLGGAPGRWGRRAHQPEVLMAVTQDCAAALRETGRPSFCANHYPL